MAAGLLPSALRGAWLDRFLLAPLWGWYEETEATFRQLKKYETGKYL